MADDWAARREAAIEAEHEEWLAIDAIQDEHEAFLDRIAPDFGSFTRRKEHSPTEVKPRWPSNVARVMREGAPPVEMLHEGWLVRGVLHWLYSDAEAGKTWLALVLALDVMRAGHVVVWVDEELGETEIARRLLALGATPEEIETKLVHYAFPGYQMTEVDVDTWKGVLRIVKPALVVFDTATDMLVAGGVDEDKGVQVTLWIKAYPEAATQRGITTLVLDHTTKGGEVGKHAVGSRAKRAKAKVQYGIEAAASYDQNKMGRVKVTRTKNTLGAVIDEVREFDVGGDGAGHFTWVLRETSLIDKLAQGKKGRIAVETKQRIVDVLRNEARPMTKSEIFDRVGGTKAKTLEYIAQVASEGVWQVEAHTPEGKTSGTVYVYSDPDAAPATKKPATKRSTKPKPATKRKRPAKTVGS